VLGRCDACQNVFSEKLLRPESGELLELQERNFNNW
jgi:hypothetical protein